MMRQISVPAPPPSAGEASSVDLGSWLTRDLRAKGAPLPSRPPPPSAEEREQAELAGWLARDLKPKHSLRPSVLPPEPMAPQPAAVAASVAPSFAPPPNDSLTPQLLPPEPSPEASRARDLEEDDLAVLPGRRRKAKAGSGRKRAVLAVAALLLLCAAVLNRRGGSAAAGLESASAAAPDTTAALPPPPPPELPQPLEAEPAPAVDDVSHGPRRAAIADEPALADPRSLLGGLAVRRYADVPSPTLSRLAREQRERARARDDAVRGGEVPAPGTPARAK